jgi:hypothetical protein
MVAKAILAWFIAASKQMAHARSFVLYVSSSSKANFISLHYAFEPEQTTGQPLATTLLTYASTRAACHAASALVNKNPY